MASVTSWLHPLTLKTFHTDGDSAWLGKLTERYDFEAFKRNEKEP